MKEEETGEIGQKYSIDLKKLEKEQLKLSKTLKLMDSIDFDIAEKIAGIDNIFFKNKIISAIVVIDNSLEITDKRYFVDKVRFPYIHGFRAYRELPAMISVFNMLEEKPDLVFIRGHGVSHPRKLGLASHFSLASGIPTIGIADSIIIGENIGEDIIIGKEIVAKVVNTKVGSKPLYVSPGNLISLKTSIELVKKFVREPHKLPEPLRLARQYAKEIMREIEE